MEEGKKILLKTFWSSKGWCYRTPTEAEFAQAKEQRYMFDFADYPPHDEALRQMRELLGQITAEDAANAFLYSLSTRKLEYRSILGSYWFAKAIPEHAMREKTHCSWCGWCDTDRIGGVPFSNRNVLNFERIKWGGIRHSHLDYILLDLTEFIRCPKATPSMQDRAILRQILGAMDELAPTKKAGAYRDLLSQKKLFAGNKQEIGVMLDILGICGVLSSEAHPCPLVSYHGVDGLPPQEHTNDFRYPVSYWHVADGVNKARFEAVFGQPFDDFMKSEGL